MENCITRKLILILLLALQTALVSAQQNWIPKGEKEGVKVFYRQNGAIQEVKLITSIQSSLSGLIQLFSEVNRYPQWGYKVAEARVLSRKSDTEFVYYSRLDFPWPLNDRDIIMHCALHQDPATGVITSTSTAEPWHLAEIADVVRIRDAHTTWKIYPNKNGWLYIEYYIYSDPGGMIPEWLVNMAIDVGPLETVKSMRNILADPRYQKARLAYIKE